MLLLLLLLEGLLLDDGWVDDDRSIDMLLLFGDDLDWFSLLMNITASFVCIKVNVFKSFVYMSRVLKKVYRNVNYSSISKEHCKIICLAILYSYKCYRIGDWW